MKEISIISKYYLNSWKSVWKLTSLGFTLEEPLAINLLEAVKELRPINPQPSKFYINPAVIYQDSQLYVYFRETNLSIRPSANSMGQMKKLQSESRLGNSVMRGTLSDSFQILSQELVVSETDPTPLEDVRAFNVGKETYLIGTHVILDNAAKDKLISTRICVRSSSGSRILNSPVSKKFEKNWVPIRLFGDVLELLHSTNPCRVISLNLSTGTQTCSVTTVGELPLKLSGGTPYLRLQDGSYLRVARRRYPLFNRGYVHLNFFAHYDENLEVIALSKPFIFRQIGFEICNGIALSKDDRIIFSWGENDEKMYIGTSTRESVTDWISGNSIQETRLFQIFVQLLLSFRLGLGVRKI